MAERIESNFSQSLPQIMSVPEMWSLVKGENSNWGIEGYEAPKKYFDYKQVKNLKEAALNNVKPKWPLKDVDGNVIVTKRPNYLDEVIKWSNSYYDKEKAEKILEEKGKSMKIKEKGTDKNATKMYKHDRDYYIDHIIRDEKKKQIYYPEKEDMVNEIAEKVKKEQSEKVSSTEKMKMKYKTFGSMPKCDRITIVSDAEYMGENMPFCNLEKVANDDKNVKKVKKGDLNIYYPNVNFKILIIEKSNLA